MSLSAEEREKLKQERLGKIFVNKRGTPYQIVEYNAYDDITIEFLDEHHYRKNGSYGDVKDGGVYNPFDPAYYGVGYLGKETAYDENGEKKPYFSSWTNMLKRCYQKGYKEKHKAYIDCTVCDEFKNYAFFEEWAEDGNWYEVNNERVQLDKDILYKGNTVYSPDTCIFVPERVNKMLVKQQYKRGNLPMGVFKTNNSYYGGCRDCNSRKIVSKGFDNPTDAFYYGYKPLKENIIHTVTNEYKNVMPAKVYEALMNYTIDIDD